MTEPTPFAVALGQRLARRRQQRGLSQAELAAALGVSVRRIASWEQGRRLPADWAGRLADALAMSADELMGRPWREWPRWS